MRPNIQLTFHGVRPTAHRSGSTIYLRVPCREESDYALLFFDRPEDASALAKTLAGYAEIAARVLALEREIRARDSDTVPVKQTAEQMAEQTAGAG